MTTSQIELTKIFLREADIAVTDESIKQWLWKIWRNPTNEYSMRLTDDGYLFLINQVELESYTYSLPKGQYASSRIYIWLDKHLTSPFWLDGRTKIIFFGSKDATILALYGGDLLAYLKNCAEN